MLVVLKLWLSFFTAYTFGVMVALPWPLWGLFNEKTLTYLAGSVLTLLFFGFVVYRITFLAASYVVFGTVIAWLWLIDVIRADPLKYQHFDFEIISGLSQTKATEIFKVTISFMISIWFLFFALYGPAIAVYYTSEHSTAYNSVIGIVGFTFFGSVFFFVLPWAVDRWRARRAGDQHWRRLEYIATTLTSAQSTWMSFVFGLSLMFAFSLGSLKIDVLTNNAAFYYSGDKKDCLVSPIMPVSGGYLFYEKTTSNYVVKLSSGETIYMPYFEFRRAETCFR